MPEHWHPTFDEAVEYIKTNLDDTLADIRDFRAAMELSDSPREIVDEYQSRRLLRQLPDDTRSN